MGKKMFGIFFKSNDIDAESYCNTYIDYFDTREEAENELKTLGTCSQGMFKIVDDLELD